MMARRAIVLCLSLAVACHGGPQSAASRAVPPAKEARSCKGMHVDAGLVPLGSSGVGSAIVLARNSASRTIAYVADEDDRAVQVVDVADGRVVARVPIDG